MGRNTSPPESFDNGGGLAGSGNDLGFHSIRDRFPLKRNPSHYRNRAKADSDHSPLHRGRSHHSRFNRKGLLWLKGMSAFYTVVILAVFVFAMASMVLQSSITLVFRQGSERGRSLREGLRFRSTLKFVPAMVSRRDGLDPLRSKPRIGVRAPRLALVVDGVHGLLFPKHNPEALMRAFSLLISSGKLSKFAQAVASSGRLLAKNMLASECITGYGRLLENVLYFPSEAMLPGPVSQLQQGAWEWNLFRGEIELKNGAKRNSDEKATSMGMFSVVRTLEEEFINFTRLPTYAENGTEILPEDIPTKLDWDVLREIEISEENERVEMEELDERMERNLGDWNEIYRKARKSEKLKFEANERDEGELERMGQRVCIYEIYSGAGSWPFLHHGSLYRGLSLSSRARRLRSDDIDAVGRLPILNDSYYQDILCETGGMFSIANRVDNIHGRPWIGFQSWRAAGRKASLSLKA